MTISSLLGTPHDGALHHVTVEGTAPPESEVEVTFEVTNHDVSATVQADANGHWHVRFGPEDDDESDATLLRGVACGTRVAARAEVTDGPYVQWGGVLDCAADAGGPGADEPEAAAARSDAPAPVVVVRQPAESTQRISVVVEGDGSVRRTEPSPDHPSREDERDPDSQPDDDRRSPPRHRSDGAAEQSPPARDPEPSQRSPDATARRAPDARPEAAPRRRRGEDTTGARPPRSEPARPEDDPQTPRARRRDQDEGRPSDSSVQTGSGERRQPTRSRSEAPENRYDEGRDTPRHRDEPRSRDTPDDMRRERGRSWDDDERYADRERYDDRPRDEDDDIAEDEQADEGTPWLLASLLVASVVAVLLALAAQGYPLLVAGAVGLALPAAAGFASATSARTWARWTGIGLGVGAALVAALLPMVGFVQMDTYLLSALVVAVGVGIGIGVLFVFGGQDDEGADESPEGDRRRRGRTPGARSGSGRSRRGSARDDGRRTARRREDSGRARRRRRARG